MMPFSKFHVLVKCLRHNDVKLVSGRDNHKAAEEYVEYIAEVIREKLALLISSSAAFSFLTDGSEARKTGLEKELVFVRLINEGIPVYFCVGLQDCNEYGGTYFNRRNFRESLSREIFPKMAIRESLSRESFPIFFLTKIKNNDGKCCFLYKNKVYKNGRKEKSCKYCKES